MRWKNKSAAALPVQRPSRGLRPGLVWTRLLTALLALSFAGCSRSPPLYTSSPSSNGEVVRADRPTATLTPSPPPSGQATAVPSATLTPSPPSSGQATAVPSGRVMAGSLRLHQVIQYTSWELVHATAWSADGAWLAVSAGETVYLYTGSTLEPHPALDIGAWASGLAFAPPESSSAPVLALAARDGAVQIWDVSTGRRLAVFSGHNKGANSVAFSPDGLLLASTGNDALVRLWDLSGFWVARQAGNLEAVEIPQQAVMIGGAFVVPVVRFSPDGSMLASVDLQAIRLRDPASTRLVRTLRGDASIFSIAFSPDGLYLAAAEMGSTLRVWQVDSGEVAAAWPAGENPKAFLWSAVFSADGSHLAAVSSQGWVYLWSFPDGELLAAFQGHSRAASAVSFSPDGRWLVTGGLDAQVKLWELP